jgi:hypothetical protein
MNAPNRLGRICLIIAAAVVAWGIAGPSRADGDEALLRSCASAIPGLPINVDMGYGAGFPLEVIAPSFAVGNENCFDFTWIGGWFWFTMLFDPEWGGPPITSSAFDCNHSTIEYAVYLGSGNSWQYWGGGLMYGKRSNGTCMYSASNPPQQPGNDTIGYANPAFFWQPAYTEFRVAVRSWSHNDPRFGHPGNLCSGLSCYWPTKLLLSGW